MIIKRISVRNIRNLQQVDLADLARVNIFSGLNGSGKSSVLEAIHVLSTGKSFRTSQLKQYISHQQQSAVVYADTSANTFAVQKFNDGKNLIKLDGQSVANFAQVAKTMPVVLIDPAMLTVLEEGSAARRALFDWAVFHVEPKFYETWIQYQRALKQRNKQLKEKNMDNIDYWELTLAELTLKLTRHRQQVFARFKPLLENYISALIAVSGAETEAAVEAKLSYGWPATLTVAEAEDNQVAAAQLAAHYKEHRRQDLERGFTYYGAHRADIRLLCKQGPVEGLYSRGQKKLLIVAFKLAQCHLLYQANQQPSVLLLDDVLSELDQQAFGRLLQLLKTLQTHTQLFITLLPHQQELMVQAVELGCLEGGYKLFHVEQGVIKSGE